MGRDQVCFKTLEKWLDRPNMLVGLLCGLLGDIRRGRVEPLGQINSVSQGLFPSLRADAHL